jgi:hypothetical protein
MKIKMFKTKMMSCLAVAAMLATACTNDEVINENIPAADAITINASTGKTRAAVADLEAVKAGFTVYATKGGSSAVEYIANQTYWYQNNAWGWKFTTIKWPVADTDYPMNFYASYPDLNAILDGSLLAEHYVTGDPLQQIDMLAANRLNVMTRPSSSCVNMDFKHILSRIGFSVKTGANVTVEVQSIAIKQVGEKRKFNYAGLEWTVDMPSAYGASYNFMTATSPANINKFVGATTGAAVTGSSGYLMLMPQDLSGRAWDKTAAGIDNQSYIEVVYRIYETATGKDIVGYSDATKHPDYAAKGDGITGALFVKVAYALPTEWLMGKAYTYTIHLGTSNDNGGNLIDDTFVDNGGGESELPVVTPDTEDPVIVPNPIFDIEKPIGFTVSVEDWDALTAQDITGK